jgi:hypothetical protein
MMTDFKESCPSEEQLGGLLDDRCDAQLRTDLYDHLAICERCYDTVIETDGISNQLNPRPRVAKYWKPLVYGASLAAAAVIAFFLLYVQKPNHSSAKVTPPAVQHPAPTPVPNPPLQAPAPVPQEQELAKDTWKPPSEREFLKIAPQYRKVVRELSAPDLNISYSFSGGDVSVSSLAFLAGADLTALQVAIASNDSEVGGQAIDRLIDILQHFDGSAPIVVELDRMKSSMQTGTMPARRPNAEKFFARQDLLPDLKFGEWTQCAFLAAASNDSSFFDLRDIHYFQKSVSYPSVSSGLNRNLKEAATIVQNGRFGKSDFKKLQQLFKDTIELI